ncbi:TonB-dependent receptor [Panacagrimonas perspica]|nr:TonB-dependent receptor [Panacagrimonas perspica]
MSVKRGSMWGVRAGLAAGMLAVVPFAHAQAVEPAAEDAAAPGAPEADAMQLDTIVVTARKREEDQTRVPLAMTTIPGDVLAQRRLDTIADLATQVPNLQIVTTTRTIYLRGVGGGGLHVGFDTRASVHVDGVYVGAPPASDSLLLDLDRVEVLRGPQGTLFGQNSTSGTLNLVTRAPDAVRHAEFVTGFGNKDGREVAASVNLPLAGDTLMLRVSGSGLWRDGFTRNETIGGQSDDVDQAGGRLRLRWIPRPGLTLDLAADQSREATRNVAGEPLTSTFGNAPPEAPRQFVLSNDTPEHDVNSNAGVSGTVQLDAGGGRFTSISAWRRAERDQLADLDRSSSDFTSYDYRDDYNYLSQELRFTSAPGRLQYLAGLYFLDAQGDSLRLATAGPDIVGGPPPFSSIVPGDAITTRPDVESRSIAGFGSLDYALTERLTLNAGLRVTQARKKAKFDQTGESFVAIRAATLSGFHDDFDETSVDPAVGLQFFAGDDDMLYARIARGSKAGGYNVEVLVAPRPGPERFDEETVLNYELGWKSAFFERRLRADLVLFYADYRDYQVLQTVQEGNIRYPGLTNAGRVQTWGPELSLDARPLRGLTLGLTLAWLHAEYESFKDAAGIGVDFSGNRTEYAPRFNGSASARYERGVAWASGNRMFVDAVLSGRTRSFAEASNESAFEIDAHTLLNAQVGLIERSDRWQIGLWAENLLDEKYEQTRSLGTFGTLSGLHGTPRTYGLQVRYAW